MNWTYIKEIFSKHGNVNAEDISCRLEYCADLEQSGIPFELENGYVTFKGTNCLDFLGKIDMLSALSSLDIIKCEVFKTDPDAVLPSKTKASDAGYDLTVIKVAKRWGSLTTLYDAGIKIKLPPGYYAEVVPRSSLSKSGYMLANSVGIIDCAYNGNIFIALTKVDPESPDIELPFRCCQLLIKKQTWANIIESSVDFEQTTRGTGGFGSTGI